jgi:hypothetical protein
MQEGKMEKMRLFKCKNCGKSLVVNQEVPTPSCCGNEMEMDLPVCTVSDTAEHARMDPIEEPCDDGRSGKI